MVHASLLEGLEVPKTGLDDLPFYRGCCAVPSILCGCPAATYMFNPSIPLVNFNLTHNADSQSAFLRKPANETNSKLKTQG